MNEELEAKVERLTAVVETQTELLAQYAVLLESIVTQVGPAIEEMRSSPLLRSVLGLKKGS